MVAEPALQIGENEHKASRQHHQKENDGKNCGVGAVEGDSLGRAH